MLKRILDRLNRLRFTRLLRAQAVTGEPAAYRGSALPRIRNSGTLTLGNGVRFEEGVKPSQITVERGSSVSIGADTFINVGVDMYSVVGITIGPDCLISTECRIFDTSFHALDEGGEPKTGRIVIGRNVWLAHGVVVLPGVTIGDHSVVGANSVVTKSIPARTFAAGCPAVPVREIVASDGFKRT